jgi:uncharacterized protein (DUF1800 family)
MLGVEASIAANRFGYGARAEDAAAIARDPRGWLAGQIVASAAPLQTAGLENATARTREFLEARAAKGDGGAEIQLRRQLKENFRYETGRAIRVAAETPQPFQERLVRFWCNHLTVSAQRPGAAPMVVSYERDAIRPHIFARFEDLLIAATRHQAMLFYLDNAASIGPSSAAGKMIKRGLNENHAREILELHTVGVDAGYAQGDVRELANILTGWSVVSPQVARRLGGTIGEAKFIAAAHEPGPKTVLGQTFAEGGEAEGVAALMFLACHPATARRIATKLARHFVADRPADAVIARLEDVYRKTNGDLRALARALIDLPEIWQTPSAKVRTPFEFMMATFRLFGFTPEDEKLPVMLQVMGHPIHTAPSPAGWPDEAKDWVAPEAMLRRIEWAAAVARRLPVREAPVELAGRALGAVARPETMHAIAAAPSPQDGVALLLASPEFQRR